MGEWVPGATVDGYRLLDRLGAGGSGEVWRARAPDGRGQVALKRLVARAAVSPDAADRVRREAERAGRLNSPHVVPVYGTGESDGVVHVVMRLVPDGDLASLLRDRPSGLTPPHAVRLVSQLAHALDTAHRHGIVHRDVTAANVLVERTAYGDVVQLGDFGLALDAGMPDPGAGTGAYRAPETSGGGPVTGAVDVYALGCLLVELLTGRGPFPGPDRAGYRWQHEHDAPRPPGAVFPSLAPFDAVVARALDKRPEHRFPTAGELAAAANRAAEAVRHPRRFPPAPPHAPPPGQVDRTRPSAAARPGSLRSRWRAEPVRVRVALTAATVLFVAAGWAAVELMIGPVPPAMFRACADRLGITVTEVDSADGPGYQLGREPAVITVSYLADEPAALSRLDLVRRYPPLPADGEQGGATTVGRALVVWQWGSHPQTVAAVQDCL